MSKADMQRENAANNKNIAVKCLSDVIKKKWKVWKFHRAAIAQNREPRSHVNRKFLNEKPFHVQFSLEWRKNSRKSISFSALAVLVRENSRLWWFRGMENMLGLLRKQTAVRMNHHFNPLPDAFNSPNMNNFIYFIRFRRVYCVASCSCSSNWRKFTGGNFRITLHGCDSSSQSVFSNADRFRPINMLKAGLQRFPICGVVRFHTPCCIKIIFYPWMAWLAMRFGVLANFSAIKQISLIFIRFWQNFAHDSAIKKLNQISPNLESLKKQMKFQFNVFARLQKRSRYGCAKIIDFGRDFVWEIIKDSNEK